MTDLRAAVERLLWATMDHDGERFTLPTDSDGRFAPAENLRELVALLSQPEPSSLLSAVVNRALRDLPRYWVQVTQSPAPRSVPAYLAVDVERAIAAVLKAEPSSPSAGVSEKEFGGKRVGKQFSSYVKFIASVRSGERSIIYGPDYVVLSKGAYEQLLKKPSTPSPDGSRP